MTEKPKDLPELSEEDDELKELLKKSAEFTREKKSEEGRKDKEEIEVTPEAGEKEGQQGKMQKELPEIFDSPKNKSLFEKLSDKTKEFAGGLYEGAKIDIIDRAKVMFSEKLLDWHHRKATRLKFELDSEKQKIEQMEAQKTRHAEILDKFQREAGHLLDAKTLIKATLEKQDLQKQIDKEKTRMERMQSSLEWRNQKKTIYERQRKDVCEDVIGRSAEKLQPFENKLKNLKGQREQLDSEIENFKKIKENLGQKLGVLKEEAQKATFKFERKVYNSRIKEIKSALKESENLIKGRAKSGNKTDKDIAKFDKKASPWRDKKTEFGRISAREVGATVVPREKKKEEIERVSEEGGEEAGQAPELKMKNFIDIWNGHFGSKIPLSAERMEKVLDTKYNSEKEVSFNFFLKELKDYYFLAKKEELIDKKKVKEKDFNRYLDIFEDVIKKK